MASTQLMEACTMDFNNISKNIMMRNHNSVLSNKSNKTVNQCQHIKRDNESGIVEVEDYNQKS